MDKEHLLPVPFYFEVVIGFWRLPFKEVSGLSSDMELEEITEGGGNDYSYYLPKRTKHGNLVLKRALRTVSYGDVVWIKNIVEGECMNMIEPKDILINLFDEKKVIISAWNCQNAFPVKWTIDSLDSEKNSVLIETIEFAYTKLSRSKFNNI